MTINPALRGQLSVVARGSVDRPKVSADGEVVVYSEHRDGFTGVYRHQDGESELLTTDRHPSMRPDLTADGNSVVYTRYSALSPNQPGNWDIVRWDSTQEQPTVIADGPGNEMGPRMSDDGRVIVWDDDVDGKLGGNNIVKWTDGQVENVTRSERLDMFPEISGNGERIVWRRFENGDSRIWLQDQNGVVKPFLQSEGDLITPALSGDGVHVVFADNSAGDEDLYLHDESNRNTRLISGVKDVGETWCDISGDGSTVVWTGLDFRKGAPADTNVFIERNGEKLQVTTADGGMNFFPQLSDDGKTLVWTWMDSENTKNRIIYKFELEDQ